MPSLRSPPCAARSPPAPVPLHPVGYVARVDQPIRAAFLGDHLAGAFQVAPAAVLMLRLEDKQFVRHRRFRRLCLEETPRDRIAYGSPVVGVNDPPDVCAYKLVRRIA